MDPASVQLDFDVGMRPEAICAKRGLNTAEEERRIHWLIRQLSL